MKRYQYLVWGLAFALTQVLVEDGDHIRIGQIYAKHLGAVADRDDGDEHAPTC